MSRIQITLRIGVLAATAALLSTTLLPAAPVLAQDDVPTTVRMYSVGDLAPPRPSVVTGSRDADFAPLDRGDEFNENAYLESWEERPDASNVAESVVELLMEAISDEDNLIIETTSTGLLAVRTTDEGHRRAAAALTLLRRQLGGAVRVDVRALTVDGRALDVDASALLAQAEAGTLDAAGVQQLIALDRNGGRRGGDLVMDPGWWSVMRQLRVTRVLTDVDVEIAQSASISDPIVSSLASGLRVACLPLLLQDGRVVLRVVATTGDFADPVRRMSLGQTANGSIELPDYHGALVASEIVLTRGRTAAVVLRQPGGDARVLLLRLDEAPRPAIGGTLALLPAAALTRSLRDVRVSWADDLAGRVELKPGVDFHVSDDDGVRLTDDFVEDALVREIGRELDEGSAYLTQTEWMGGGTILVRAAESGIGRVRRALADLEAASITSVRVSIRIEERDGGAARVVGTLAGPGSDGATIAMGAYRSLTYVADQDVEVAEAAQISDPRIESALVGALANVRVHPVEGEFSVELGLRVSALVSGPDQISHAAENVGLLERVVTEERSISTRLRVAPGREAEIVLGDSVVGLGGRLVAVVRVDRM